MHEEPYKEDELLLRWRTQGTRLTRDHCVGHGMDMITKIAIKSDIGKISNVRQ
jgi:hypothetical protein